MSREPTGPPRAGVDLVVAGLEAAGVTLAASVPDTWIALGWPLAVAVPDVAALRAAFPRVRQEGGPALLVLEVLYDPAEPIPPYSERPEEIRTRFRVPPASAASPGA